MIINTSVIRLLTNSTHFLVPSVSHTGVICSNPHTAIWQFLKRNLIEYDFDAKLKIWTPSYHYYFYNKEAKQYHLPINVLKAFTEFLRYNGVTYEIEAIAPTLPLHVNYQISDTFALRDHQVKPVSYLTNKDAPIRSVELTCGSGKTFMSIVALAKLGVRTLIVVPTNLKDQWLISLKTLLPNKEVYQIQGYKSVELALNTEEIYGPDGPSIFIASNRTLAFYAGNNEKYSEFPPFEEFISKMRFGAKIIDEIHMGFGMNVSIDLRCNIPNNIYLSATYLRTSTNSKKIFDRIFPAHQRFIGESADRHVNLTEIDYRITEGEISKWNTETNRGYSQFKYEAYVMKYNHRVSKIVNMILKPIIIRYFIERKDPGQKLLIIVGLKEFAYLLENILGEIFHDQKVSAFLAEHGDEVLEESDIIISTIKSMGTGKDVAGMKTLICFSSISSEVQNLQLMGRLRKIEGTDCEFIYLVNRFVKSHGRHAMSRRQLFNDRVKKFERRVM